MKTEHRQAEVALKRSKTVDRELIGQGNYIALKLKCFTLC